VEDDELDMSWLIAEPVHLDDPNRISHPMRLVASLCLGYVGYDAPEQVLYVTMLVDGSKHAYYPVPFEAYRAMMEAASVGKFFNKYVKRNLGYTHEAL
jgi:hypothetical protein